MGITIAALIPAAGASRRMGRDKRCIPYRGQTVLETTVAVMRRAGASSLWVVLEQASPCRALPGLADAHLLENPRPERGMLSSIRVGLEALGESVDAVAVQPGDHPFVPLQAVRALFDHYRSQRPLLLVPRYPRAAQQMRGHPLLIARELFGAALACDDEVGLRQLLQRQKDALEVLDLDFAGADEDLDTPEDLRKLE